MIHFVLNCGELLIFSTMDYYGLMKKAPGHYLT